MPDVILTKISTRTKYVVLDVTKEGPLRCNGLGLCLFLAEDQHEAELAQPEGQRAGDEHGTLLFLLDVTGSGLPCGSKVLARNGAGIIRAALIPAAALRTNINTACQDAVCAP